MEEQSIVLDAGGRMFRERFTREEIPANLASQVLRNYAADTRVPIVGLFSSESFGFWSRFPKANPNFNPVEHVAVASIGMMISKNSCCIYGRLTKLRLTTAWQIRDGIQTPMFRAPSAGIMRNTGIFNLEAVKDAMSFWLAVNFKVNEKGNIIRSNETMVYMVATAPGEAGTFKPMLPNIYEDGRVCMGDAGYALVREQTFPLVLLSVALQEFNMSEWNSDLAGQIEDYNKMYSTSISDNSPVNFNSTWLKANPTVWKRVRISNRHYSDIPLITV